MCARADCCKPSIIASRCTAWFSERTACWQTVPRMGRCASGKLKSSRDKKHTRHKQCNSGAVTLLVSRMLHSYCFNGLAYNFNEIRLNTCSPYQRAIDIGMSHKLARVVRSYAAAIEDAQGLGCFT